MQNESDFLMDVLAQRFPDGVDVLVVQHLQVKECAYPATWNVPGHPFAIPLDPSEPVEPGVFYTNLVEVEPESGVFAGQSELSHNVFVYFAPESYL